MGGLAFSEIADAVLETQENFINRGSFVNMQTDLTNHVAVREMWMGRKKKFDGGKNWRFEVQTDHNHSARAVGLYEADGTSMADTLVKGEVAPRHVNAHYVFDLREPDFQAGGHAIVDFVESKMTAMMVSFWDTLERYLWGKPDDSNDTKIPFGVDYWVTRNAVEGFTGGDPAGFSAGRGGISTANVPRYANRSGRYVNVTVADLLRKMRRAHRLSQFRSPVQHKEPTLGGSKNGIYCAEVTINSMEELLETRNMNLGNDLASKDGRTLFKGTPITYVPFLNDDSGQPVYMLDWMWLAIGVLTGWERNLSKPMPVPGRHTVRRVDLDVTLNMVGTDPRRQTVLYK